MTERDPCDDRICPECGVWSTDAHECDPDVRERFRESQKDRP